jgi:hypothetical protein
MEDYRWYKIGPLTTGDMSAVTPVLIATTPVANKSLGTNGQLYYRSGYLYSMDSYCNTIKIEVATGDLTVINNPSIATIDSETGSFAGANGFFNVMYNDYGKYATHRYSIGDANHSSSVYPPNIFRTGAMCSSQDDKYIYCYSHMIPSEHNSLVQRCSLVKYKILV